MSTVMEADNEEMIVKRVSVPLGLEELMEGLTKEVILKKPDDIYLFAAEYFSKLLSLREKGHYKVKSVASAQSVIRSSKQPIEKLLIRGASKQLSRQISIRGESPVKRNVLPRNQLNRKDQKEGNSIDRNKFMERRNKMRKSEAVENKNVESKPTATVKANTGNAEDKSNKRDRSVSTSRRGRSVTKSVQSTPRQKSTSTPRTARNDSGQKKAGKNNVKEDEEHKNNKVHKEIKHVISNLTSENPITDLTEHDQTTKNDSEQALKDHSEATNNITLPTENLVKDKHTIQTMSAAEENNEALNNENKTDNDSEQIKMQKIYVKDDMEKTITIDSEPKDKRSIPKISSVEETHEFIKDGKLAITPPKIIKQPQMPKNNELISSLVVPQVVNNISSTLTKNESSSNRQDISPNKEETKTTDLTDDNLIDKIREKYIKDKEGALEKVEDKNSKEHSEQKHIDQNNLKGEKGILSGDVSINIEPIGENLDTVTSAIDEDLNTIINDSSDNKSDENMKQTNETGNISNIETVSLVTKLGDEHKPIIEKSSSAEHDTVKNSTESVNDKEDKFDASKVHKKRPTGEEKNEEGREKIIQGENIYSTPQDKQKITTEPDSLEYKGEQKDLGEPKGTVESSVQKDSEPKIINDEIKDNNNIVESVAGEKSNIEKNKRIMKSEIKKKTEAEGKIMKREGETDKLETLVKSEDKDESKTDTKDEVADTSIIQNIVDHNKIKTENEKAISTGHEVKKRATSLDEDIENKSKHSALIKTEEDNKYNRDLGSKKEVDSNNVLHTSLIDDKNEFKGEQMTSEVDKDARNVPDITHTETEICNIRHKEEQSSVEAADLFKENKDEKNNTDIDNEVPLKDLSKSSDNSKKEITSTEIHEIHADIEGDSLKKCALKKQEEAEDEPIKNNKLVAEEPNQKVEIEYKSKEELKENSNVPKNKPLKEEALQSNDEDKLKVEDNKMTKTSETIKNVENKVLESNDKLETKSKIEGKDDDSHNDSDKNDLKYIETNKDNVNENVQKQTENTIGKENTDDSTKEGINVNEVSGSSGNIIGDNFNTNAEIASGKIHPEGDSVDSSENILKQVDNTLTHGKMQTNSENETKKIVNSHENRKDLVEENGYEAKQDNALKNMSSADDIKPLSTDFRNKKIEHEITKTESFENIAKVNEEAAVVDAKPNHLEETNINTNKEDNQESNVIKNVINTVLSVVKEKPVNNVVKEYLTDFIQKEKQHTFVDTIVDENLSLPQNLEIKTQLSNRNVHTIDSTEDTISEKEKEKGSKSESITENADVTKNLSDVNEISDTLNPVIKEKKSDDAVTQDNYEASTPVHSGVTRSEWNHGKSEANSSNVEKTEDSNISKTKVMKYVTTDNFDETVEAHINRFLHSEKTHGVAQNIDDDKMQNLTEINQEPLSADNTDTVNRLTKNEVVSGDSISDPVDKLDSDKNVEKLEDVPTAKDTKNRRSKFVSQTSLKLRENIPQSSKKNGRSIRRVKTADVIKDDSKTKTEVKSRIPTADYRHRVKRDTENGKHTMVIKQVPISQIAKISLADFDNDNKKSSVTTEKQNVETPHNNSSDGNKTKIDNQQNVDEMKKSTEEDKKDSQIRTYKSDFDISELRKEIKTVEDESKLAKFKSSFNPYVLRQEIKNSSNEEVSSKAEDFRKLPNLLTDIAAALKIQSIWRGYVVRKNKITVNRPSKYPDKDVKTKIHNASEVRVVDQMEKSDDKSKTGINSNQIKSKSEKHFFADNLDSENKLSESMEKPEKSDINKEDNHFVNAATKIQSIWRGFQARKFIKQKAQQDKLDNKVSEHESEMANNENNILQSEKRDKFTNAAIKIQSIWRAFRVRRNLKKDHKRENVHQKQEVIPETCDNDKKFDSTDRSVEEDKSQDEKQKTESRFSRDEVRFRNAAVTIQRIWRGFQVRNTLKVSKIERDRLNKKKTESEIERSPENKYKNEGDFKGSKKEDKTPTVSKNLDSSKLTTKDKGEIVAMDETKDELKDSIEITTKDIGKHLSYGKLEPPKTEVGDTIHKQQVTKCEEKVLTSNASPENTVSSNSNSGEIDIKEGKTEPKSPPEEFKNNHDKFLKAAIKIQKIWRGFRVRKHLNKNGPFGTKVEIEHPIVETVEPTKKIDHQDKRSALKIQSLWRGYQVRKNIGIIKNKLEDRNAAKTEIERKIPEEDILNAATKIQAGIRGYLQRKKYKKSINKLNSISEEEESISNGKEPLLNNVVDTKNEATTIDTSKTNEAAEEVERESSSERKLSDAEIFKALEKLSKLEIPNDIPWKDQNTKPAFYRSDTVQEPDIIKKESPLLLKSASLDNNNNSRQFNETSKNEMLKDVLGNEEKIDSDKIVIETGNEKMSSGDENRQPHITELKKNNLIYNDFTDNKDMRDSSDNINKKELDSCKEQSVKDIITSVPEENNMKKAKLKSTNIPEQPDSMEQHNIFSISNENSQMKSTQDIVETTKKNTGANENESSTLNNSNKKRDDELQSEHVISASTANDVKSGNILGGEKHTYDTSTSVDSTSSAVTVLGQSVEDIKDNETNDNNHETESSKNGMSEKIDTPESPDDIKETFLEHEYLINDIQNKLLDQISGKNGEKTSIEYVNTKFDIEKLRNELKEAGLIYSSGGNINIKHQNSKEEVNVQDQLLDYLHNFDSDSDHDQLIYVDDSSMNNRSSRDLPDIKEEELEAKPVDDDGNNKKLENSEKITEGNAIQGSNTVNANLLESELNIQKIQSTLRECENIAQEINKGFKNIENDHESTNNSNINYQDTEDIRLGHKFCGTPTDTKLNSKYNDNDTSHSEDVELINNTKNDILKGDCKDNENVSTDFSSTKDGTEISSVNKLLHTDEVTQSTAEAPLLSTPTPENGKPVSDQGELNNTTQSDTIEQDKIVKENLDTVEHNASKLENASSDLSINKVPSSGNRLLHTGELHDSVVVPLLSASGVESHTQDKQISDNDKSVSNQSELNNIAKSGSVKQESSNAAKENLNSNKLLHSGELHDTVVVPLLSSGGVESQEFHTPQYNIQTSEDIKLVTGQSALNITKNSTIKQEDKIPKENFVAVEPNALKFEDEDLSSNNDDDKLISSNNKLLHSGELHDTVVVPLLSSSGVEPQESHTPQYVETSEDRKLIPGQGELNITQKNIIIKQENNIAKENLMIVESNDLKLVDVPSDFSSNNDGKVSSPNNKLLHSGELHDTVMVPLSSSRLHESYSPQAKSEQLSSTDTTESQNSSSKLLHTGELHDRVVVSLPLKIPGESEENVPEKKIQTTKQTNTLEPPDLIAGNMPSETESIKDKINGQGLLHTGEIHDTIVVSVPISEEEKRCSLESHEIKEGKQENLGLLHTGELHDSVVPLIQDKQTHETEVDGEGAKKENPPSRVDGQSQTTGDAIAVQLNQAPAGVAVLTSPRPVSGVQDVTGVDTDIAQAPDKDALPTEPNSDFSAPSDLQSMESEKRKNATINNESMEAEAATKIQAGFRGYQVRKQLKLKNGSSDINSQRRQARRKSSGRLTDTGRMSQNKPKDSNEIEEKSAVKIQAGVRGFLVRRRQKKQKTQES